MNHSRSSIDKMNMSILDLNLDLTTMFMNVSPAHGFHLVPKLKHLLIRDL